MNKSSFFKFFCRFCLLLIETASLVCYTKPRKFSWGIIMKINWYKIASAVQLLIGVAAVVAFFVMAFDGGDIRPWVITVTLAVVLVVFGTTGVTKGSPYDDK